jgi:hypothetical protein
VPVLSAAWMHEVPALPGPPPPRSCARA